MFHLTGKSGKHIDKTFGNVSINIDRLTDANVRLTITCLDLTLDALTINAYMIIKVLHERDYEPPYKAAYLLLLNSGIASFCFFVFLNI